MKRAEHRNHVWTWDVVLDRTTRGGTLRVLTLVARETAPDSNRADAV